MASLAEKSSYYYAHKGPGSAPPPQHVPLADAAPVDSTVPHTEEKASAWNKGSWTWEEKDLSKYACGRLKELLSGLELGENIAISSVSDVTGEAHILHTRGKKRVGYEFETKIKWSCSTNGEQGELILEDISSDNSDGFDASVKITKDGPNSVKAEILKNNKAKIAALIETLKTELMER